MNSTDIVRGFWETMRSNDYARAAKDWLAPEFVGLWPQSGEVIRGRVEFAKVNAAFPGRGHWTFEEVSLIAEGSRVVTDMRVTNPLLEVTARALTFHDITESLICRQTEYWPDQYEVPAWRKGVLEVSLDIARW
ncbi:MAG: nuclear transport factor 2 family protein [Paracoccus sp. (in: a-proteobacteria)]